MRRMLTIIIEKMKKIRTIIIERKIEIKNNVEDVPEAANQVGSGR
jgi:hypothetical protein